MGIARLAAELPAARRLRLPDAVVVATGLRHGADVILTGDAAWQGIEKVRVVTADPEAQGEPRATPPGPG